MKHIEKNKHVLVIGSSGQLGQTIKEVENLFDNIIFQFKDRTELDICNHEEVITYFKSSTIDFVINCAAYTNVELAEKEPKKAFKVNSEAVKNLANVCAEEGSTLIHISTDYVFDGKKNEAYLEIDTPNPLNIYGRTKLEGEKEINEISKKHYLIRTSWLYSKYKNNFFTFIFNNVSDSKELFITTNQKGVPTSTKSLTKFILFLIQNQEIVPFGTYNYVDNGLATWYSFAREIEKHYFSESSKLINKTANYPSKAKRPMNSVLSNDKVKKYYDDIPAWQKAMRHVF